jgi:hypothetical protein
MRCGHVGEGRFIPITYVVNGNSKSEAIEAARRIPRVKHEDPDAVIHISTCSEEEARQIRAINNNDPYLKSTYDNPIDLELIKDRIKKMPNRRGMKSNTVRRASNLWQRTMQEAMQYAY